MIKKFFGGIALLGFLASCASSQKAELNGAYRLLSKAKVTDKLSNESHNVDLVITVLPEKAVRMDVTALLGYRVAEVVMTPQEVQYLHHEDKIFVQGIFKPKSMKPLFKQEIDPKLFWSIAHEKFVKDGKYYGAELKSELLEKNENGYMPRKITIESSNFKMIWLFKDKEPAASYNETFVLSKPDEYKLITIK